MALPFPTRPSVALLLGAAAAGLVYLAGLAVYRLFLSPIAKFPGPRLAALSRWYEFYYDCVLPGQYTFHIQKLHKQYGKYEVPRPERTLLVELPSHCPRKIADGRAPT